MLVESSSNRTNPKALIIEPFGSGGVSNKIEFIMNLSENLFLTVVQRDKEITVDFSQQFRRGNAGLEREPFHWHLNGSDWDTTGVTDGTFGDVAIWLPSMPEATGIKIIREKHPGYLDGVMKNLAYIQSIKSDIFPEIFEFHLTTVNGQPCVVVLMKNVSETDAPVLDGSESWLPSHDRQFVEGELTSPLSSIRHAIEQFAQHQLCPDLNWAKPVNFRSGKCIDFHDFTFMPERYVLPNTAGKTKEELVSIFETALKKFALWSTRPEADGKPRWQGKFYQPILFSEVGVPGYTSDDRIFDSWVKLPLIPFAAPIVKNGKVLELGSANGLFPILASIHGCEEAIGVEYSPDDHQLAVDVNTVTRLPNVKFINDDAVSFVANDLEKYGLVILSSVLHQIFPDFSSGADRFMTSLLDRCSYLFFESPANHKQMNMPLERLYEKLVSLCGGNEDRVRLLYLHDSYSSGYRVQFLCYGRLADV